jgi:hypothetical protein
VRRFYDYAGPNSPLATNLVVLPSSSLHGVCVLFCGFSKLNSPAH